MNFSSPRQFLGGGDWREPLRANWQYLTAWLNSIQKRTVVELTAAETISTSTTTAVPWDAVRGTDELNAWSSASPTQLTVKVPGRYQVAASAAWATDATGWRFVGLFKNGSGTSAFADRRASFAGNTPQQSVISYPHDLLAGDYWEAKVAQNSGGDVNVNATDVTYFAMWRVS